ncbi:hypothetical protein IAT38_007170 [Cryptococcus sp. DSM 104549]
MSQYTPYQNNGLSGRYTPPRSGDQASHSFPPVLGHGLPSYPYKGMPNPSGSSGTYRGYDDRRPQKGFGYEQSSGRPPHEERYDPYQPSNVYNPAAPQMRLPHNGPSGPPTSSYGQQFAYRPPSPPRRPPSPHRQPPFSHQSPNQQAHRNSLPLLHGNGELTIQTPPTSINAAGQNTVVYSLPPSILPITKLVAVNPQDAVDLHHRMSSMHPSVWYTGGCSRAAEAWCTAVEWKTDEKTSGKKMRGLVAGGDALDAELGGIYKAVEGFHDLLEKSVRTADTFSLDLVIFCDSQAAIVAIDTASRPEALRFDQLWRNICTDFLRAHITLVWIPRDSNIEGSVLTGKIAVVAANNSYTKRRKERALPEHFARAGTGDAEKPASTVPGAWQKGDADPARIKVTFERPQPPPPLAPTKIPSPPPEEDIPAPPPVELETLPPPVEGDEPDMGEGTLPDEGAIFVSHFPPEVSARDIGMLFAQFGDIEAVDVFACTEAPRYANVTFVDSDCNAAALRALHQTSLKFDSLIARDDPGSFDVWKRWGGQLIALPHEPCFVVPPGAHHEYQAYPRWLIPRGKRQERALETAEEIKKRERGSLSQATSIKREVGSLSPKASEDSQSPRKRARQDEARERSGSLQPMAKRPLPSVHSPPTASVSPNKLSAVSLPHGAEPASRTLQSNYATGARANNQPGHLRLATSGTDHPSGQGASSESPHSHPYTNGAGHMPPHIAHPPYPHNNPILPPLTRQHPSLPPTPATAERPTTRKGPSSSSSGLSNTAPTSQSLATSTTAPLEHPITVGASTLRAQISLVLDSLMAHDVNNWVAHTCLIAASLDEERRALEAILGGSGRYQETTTDLERMLNARGFTLAKIDAFVEKVLKVLDGIAAAEEADGKQASEITSGVSGPAGAASQVEVDKLVHKLRMLLEPFPAETKEAMANASKIMEYLIRGRELQENKAMAAERRTRVLEGMAKVGDVVSAVVRYLLMETD